MTELLILNAVLSIAVFAVVITLLARGIRRGGVAPAASPRRWRPRPRTHLRLVVRNDRGPFTSDRQAQWTHVTGGDDAGRSH